jgi:hypothetical protein
MIVRRALCCAMLMCFATFSWGADKAPPKKATAKKAAKAAPKASSKSAAKPRLKGSSKSAAKPAAKVSAKTAQKRGIKSAKAVSKQAGKPVQRTSAVEALRARKAAYTPGFAPTPKLTGKRETLTCRDGTEDRHARIGVVLIGGKVDSFAYYSKWKPRTCSIYLQRNRDPYSRWVDKGGVTHVNLEHGLFMIEQDKGAYRFVFRDIDRERFCGMDGTINGSLTIRKGTERCEVVGIMEEGLPLGEAYAHLETGQATDVPASDTPRAATAAQRTSWWSRWLPRWSTRASPQRPSASPFPIESESPGD